MILIDKLCYNSKLRYINAETKFAFAILSLVICIASKSILVAIIIGLVNTYLTVIKGGIKPYRYLRLLMIPMVFLSLSTLAIFVNISMIRLDLFSIPIGRYYITGSYQGLLRALQLMLGALSAVSCLYFLSLSTPITDIIRTLNKLHLPKMIVELMLLIYRFIFILLDIASAIKTSQEARLGNHSFQSSIHSFSLLGRALFIRSIQKADILYDAMEARCYDGSIHTISRCYDVRRIHIVLMACYLFILLLLSSWRTFL